MKNVWILNHYAVPPGVAGGTRHYSLAKHLSAYGWQAQLLAASVEHASGRQRLTRGENERLETFDGVSFLWLRTTGYQGNGSARMRNMLQYAWRARSRASTRGLPRPDVVIGSSVHPFAAVAGQRLARRFKVPFVFEVRDLWPQTLIDMGRISKSGVMARAMGAMERWLYGRADRIVTLLPRAVDYMTPLGVPENKVVWIPNGVELGTTPDPAPPAKSHAADGFTLMYFGAHGQANGLDNVLQAMKRIQDRGTAKHIRLRMIGDGPDKSALRELAKKLELDNVSFEPAVRKAEVPQLATQADAFVFNLKHVPVFRFGISSNKLFDFLAGSRPIIFCCDAVNNPVDEAGAGCSVPPENPEALAQAIVEMAELPEDVRRQMGEAGRRYVEQHNDFKVLAGRLATVLDECVDHYRVTRS